MRDPTLPVHKSAHLPVHVYYIFEERERERNLTSCHTCMHYIKRYALIKLSYDIRQPSGLEMICVYITMP